MAPLRRSTWNSPGYHGDRNNVFLWGYLADRVGRRRLLAAAVFFGEIPCFLTAFARNYYELLLLRALMGIGINGAVPAARAMIADLYPPDERGRAMPYTTSARGSAYS